MGVVVCSSCRVRGIPNGKENLSMGIVVLLWSASVICVMREGQCVAPVDLSVAPWILLLRSIHWLYAYSCMVLISVLVH